MHVYRPRLKELLSCIHQGTDKCYCPLLTWRSIVWTCPWDHQLSKQ